MLGVFIADKFGKFVTCKLKCLKLKCLKFMQQKAKKLAKKFTQQKAKKILTFIQYHDLIPIIKI